MDLENNTVGSEIGKEYRELENAELLKLCLNQLEEGRLLFIKQNDKGDFLDVRDEIILPDKWQGIWVNERVLVPTNWITIQSQN